MRQDFETVVDAGQSTFCTDCGRTLRANALVECVVVDGLGVTETRCLECARATHDGAGTLVEGQLAPAVGPGGHSRLILAGVSIVE